MHSEEQKSEHKVVILRRQLLYLGGLTMAASALAEPMPGVSAEQKFAGDLAILNVALGLEHQAIAAYDAGAGSKLLTPDQLKLAVSFQNDHKRHRNVLVKFIRRFGGKPVDPESKYDFGTITSATDIVKLAHKLEEGAAKAYLTHAYKLQSIEILDAAVPILVDEVRHTTVFRQLLGLSVTERLTV